MKRLIQKAIRKVYFAGNTKRRRQTCLCQLGACDHMFAKCERSATKRYLTEDFDLDLCDHCYMRRVAVSGKDEQ